MQILANALPGFRDLRSPVIAGYLWLLVGWVLVSPDINSRPENAVAASLYDLADRLGKIGTAVAVSVAAYLVGSVSQELTNGFPRLWRKVRAWKPLAPIAR